MLFVIMIDICNNVIIIVNTLCSVVLNWLLLCSVGLNWWTIFSHFLVGLYTMCSYCETIIFIQTL